MHTAILSAQSRMNNGELRASALFAGKTVLGWQADLAIKLGCKKVIVLCDAPTRDILDVQAQLERHGCTFHTARTLTQLTSLLNGAGVVLTVQDGLVVLEDIARKTLFQKDELQTGVLTLAASRGASTQTPNEFERIDAERLWAGVACLPNSEACKLDDFPADGDAISLLLRIGLQARVPTIDISQHCAAQSHCFVAEDALQMRALERAKIDASLPEVSISAPFVSFSTFVTKILGARGLKNGAQIALGLSLLCTAMAFAFVWFAAPAFGLAFIALASFFSQQLQSWAELRWRLSGQSIARAFLLYYSMISDILVIILLLVCLSLAGQAIPILAIPVFAIGLARLVSTQMADEDANFWSDRTFHLVFFTFCGAIGYLTEGIAVFGLGALLHLLLRDWLSRASQRATMPE